MRRISLIIGGLLALSVAATAIAGLSPGSSKGMSRSFKPANLDLTSMYDVNNLNMVVTNIGSFGYDDGGFYGKNDGLYYPARDTTKAENTSVIYAGGIWVGARVGGETRVAIAEYSQDYVPGPMIGGSPAPDDETYRVYKINRGDVTSDDYLNWPVGDGAPVDENGDPLLLGDQTMWCVYNDADPTAHASGETRPLGIEVQQTIFGFARTGALGNCAFVKFLIINKGSNTLEDAYVSPWADPDLGDAMDDLVGCDTTLDLGYCYNDGSDAIYGANPPAVGFALLQGPMVPATGSDNARAFGQVYPGHRNLPMTAFSKYINGMDPDNATQSYNYMQGLNKDGSVVFDPWGVATTHMTAGDPVTGTGWIDSNSADRRFLVSSGPFTMEPGDSQEVIIAVCVGHGADRLLSITDLRETVLAARAAYDNQFMLSGEIPTFSEWGVIVFGLLLLISMVFYVVRRSMLQHQQA
jgi:hypothetical protein